MPDLWPELAVRDQASTRRGKPMTIARWHRLGRWSWTAGRTRRRTGVRYDFAAECWVVILFGFGLAVGHA
jgi:hypothetical protein